MLFHIENITRIVTTFAAHSYCAIKDDDALAFLLVCVCHILNFGQYNITIFDFIIGREVNILLFHYT